MVGGRGRMRGCHGLLRAAEEMNADHDRLLSITRDGNLIENNFCFFHKIPFSDDAIEERNSKILVIQNHPSASMT